MKSRVVGANFRRCAVKLIWVGCKITVCFEVISAACEVTNHFRTLYCVKKELYFQLNNSPFLCIAFGYLPICSSERMKKFVDSMTIMKQANTGK